MEEKEKERYKKELKRFDPILKEIFSEAIGTIYYLATGKKIGKKVKVISAEISLVKTFRPDILVEADGEIIQVEIQAQQDKSLPKRMFRYYYAISEKYKKEPTQIVLFVGKGNPPPSEYKTPKLTLKYEVLDMKKIDPDVFIKSKKPGEVIVGILAGKFKDKSKIIKKVKKRIVEILKNEEKIALSQSSEIIISPLISKILQKFHFKSESIITICLIHMFITTSFKLTVNKEEKEQILKLMRSFSSAVRFSYKRLLEGFTTLQAYTITRRKFPELNSHYVNCAVEKAGEIFSKL
jgi:predicted transposase